MRTTKRTIFNPSDTNFYEYLLHKNRHFNYNIKSNIKSNWEQYVKRNNLDYDYISNEDFENILKNDLNYQTKIFKGKFGWRMSEKSFLFDELYK